VSTVATRRAVLLATVCALVGLPASLARRAAADQPDGRSTVVVCYPNAPGSTEAARPVMERLGAHLTWRTGFELQPVYTNDAAEARRWIDERHPRFAILSLPLFLAWREPLHLSVVAQSERQNSATERYHLLVAQGAPWRTLADFKQGAQGRRPVIWSSHLDDPRFVSRVVFAGALAVAADEAGDARGVVTAQPLKALRRMKGGEALEGQPVDAVLLEDAAWTELQKLQAFREGVRALFTSAPLPTPPVVALGEVDPQDVERLRGALLGMNDDAEGRDLLTTLQVTSFVAPTPDAMQAAITAYGEAAR
jgi:ABC-type phosphate/phosphonate transport system substrate-binding protein